MRKHRMLEEILRLDPEHDHQRIGYIDAFYEFPWDTTRSLELALVRTFCVPRTSALMVGSGEFTHSTQRRYDDTTLILSEVLEHGYDSPRGRDALRRMNRQHGAYTISNEEFLYVLSTFIYEPINWNRRFGWRLLVRQEKLSSYYFWRAIGRFMNIKDIPDTYSAFARFKQEFERDNFRYAPSNQQLAEVTERMLLGWYMPAPLYPLGRRVLHTFMDGPMLAALGFPEPGPGMRRLVQTLMRLRALVVRNLPERRKPKLYTKLPNRSYPKGYKIEELGRIP